MGGAVAATAALSLGMGGCEGGEEDGIEGSTCVSTDEYFAVTFFEVIHEKCGTCHEGGDGSQQSEFKMVPTSQAGFLTTNLEALRKVANVQTDETSIVLQKPLGKLDHGGGTIFESEDDPGYQKIVKLVQRLNDSDSCPNTEARFIAGVQMSGPTETYRKAALSLAARLPTEEEEQIVADGGMPAALALMDGLMKEEAFYERLKEKYNDLMLTDFYLGDEFDVIGGGDQYNPRWYEEINTNDADLIKKFGARDAEDLGNKLARWTRTGVARAGVELIAYTVKNDLPYTNIVTADYMVVNPFSAKAYNIPSKDAVFKNDADPKEFIPVRLGGYDSNFPHAGVITDPIYLQRHPTTETNRNRHRAKEILFTFLGNDILKAAERPIAIDENSLADNPTLNNQNCTICHYVIDPIAGAFRNFQPTFEGGDDDQFTFRPDAEWFPEMAQTGFREQKTPPSSYSKATAWLGQQIANDPGFAFASVFAGYRILTGHDPLTPPQNGSDNFDAELTAFLGQYYTFSKIAEDFRNNGYNFKQMIKDLVLSPYFRAINAAENIDPLQLTHLSEVGSAHLLTPEQLNRKIEKVMGLSWTPNEFETPNLLNPDGGEGYRILFGGIDSMNTTNRITTPSGIMANVAERMGAEVGCRVSNAEFSIPLEERKFLKHSELTDEPQDANFRDVPASIDRIKQDIQYLHLKLLGEKLELGDPELERTYKLFVDVWKEGRTNVVPVDVNFPDECVSGRNYVTGVRFAEEEILRDDGLYTGRAWSAVFAYLMTDYSFLYE